MRSEEQDLERTGSLALVRSQDGGGLKCNSAAPALPKGPVRFRAQGNVRTLLPPNPSLIELEWFYSLLQPEDNQTRQNLLPAPVHSPPSTGKEAGGAKDRQQLRPQGTLG